ncbi:MAG: DUF411 domain-containing protein [Gemmatimonadetes bacterium]|nr:DUF411 domain-containing protein [Gemmatimonadota bacterium]
MRRLDFLALALLAACGTADATPDASATADAGGSLVAATAEQQQLPSVLVYKTATCGCCHGWVEHMQAAGFTVDARDVPGNVELMGIKADAGVPAEMSSCHTSLIDGYVVEGHVPADQVKRLLAERPSIVGIAAPGMPAGSPGMDIPNSPPYDIIAWRADGTRSVFAEVTPR